MNQESSYPENTNASEYEEEITTEGKAPTPTIERKPPSGEIIQIAHIQRMNIDQLNAYGKNIGLRHLGSLTKSQMVFEIVKAISENPNEILYGEGVLEVLPDGFGFLRSPNYNYLPSAEDIYVSPAQIRRFDLKKGDTVCGGIRPPRKRKNTSHF